MLHKTALSLVILCFVGCTSPKTDWKDTPASFTFRQYDTCWQIQPLDYKIKPNNEIKPLLALNLYMQRFKIGGNKRVWLPPILFVRFGRGVCKEFALFAHYVTLKMGYDSRLVFLKVPECVKHEYHAICVVYLKTRYAVFDMYMLTFYPLEKNIPRYGFLLSWRGPKDRWIHRKLSKYPEALDGETLDEPEPKSSD